MIILHKSRNKQFYFTVVASNGRVLATSETYTRKESCLNGIYALQYRINETWNDQIKDETKKPVIRTGRMILPKNK